MNRLQPLISILIPVYNDEHIIRCLNSVCKQTYKNIEIIIVDDGSNKNITNSFAYFQNTHLNNKIIVIHNATNEGVGPSRNKLLSLYSGEGFIFMDSDDEFYNENSIMLLYEKSENLQKDVTIGHSHFVGTYRKDGVLPLTKWWCNRSSLLIGKHKKLSNIFPKINGFFWWNTLFSRKFQKQYSDIKFWSQRKSLDEETVLIVLLMLAKSISCVSKCTYKYHYGFHSTSYVSKITVSQFNTARKYLEYSILYFDKYKSQITPQLIRCYYKWLWHLESFYVWRLWAARKINNKTTRLKLLKSYREVILKVTKKPTRFHRWWHFFFSLPSMFIKTK